MALVIRELHQPSKPDLLNEEWLVIENTGSNPWNAHGCALLVARNPTDRPRPLGTLDPGFVLQPNEKIRLVTGSPGKKAQGTPPDEKQVKNYHLFLKEQMLPKPGTVVRVSLKQAELARAVFEPESKDGLSHA